jgi:gas vesicle protein
MRQGQEQNQQKPRILGLISTLFLTSESSGYPNTPKKKYYTLKAHPMMMIEDFKKDKNNPLKEIQKNTGKQVEDVKKDTQKFLKELQENISKEVKLLNKTIQDLKMKIETIKK